MICALCPNPTHKDLSAASGRQVCLPCGTAIANAIPTLATRPNRRAEVMMLLTSLGYKVSPVDRYVMEMAEYSTDEQIRGAVLIAKQSCANPSVGYVAGVLRNERSKPQAQPVQPAKQEQGEAVESWKRQGFVSEADYLACDQAYTAYKWKAPAGRVKPWAQFKSDWLSEAV